MSISPVDASAAHSSGQAPSTLVGKASPTPDPVVSSGGVVTTPATSTAKASDSELSDAINTLKNSDTFRNSTLSFSLDKDTGDTVVKITDSKTDQVIRQIPSEDALRMARSIDAMQGKGKLINAKA
jgi:flagellar protein FlaG